MSQLLPKRFRRVLFGTALLTLLTVIAPAAALAEDDGYVGICVIGVVSPCNAPQYWSLPSPDDHVVKLPNSYHRYSLAPR